MLDAQRFLNDIMSGYWWLSVVVVGLAINLASAYLKSPLDRLLAHWSRRRLIALEAKESEKHARAKLLASSGTLLAIEIRNEAVSILIGIFAMATAAAFISTASWGTVAIQAEMPFKKLLVYLLLTLAGVLMALGLHLFNRALGFADRISYVRHYLSQEGDG